MNQTKTYRAIRHDVVRKRQKENAADAHHPDEKKNQIIACLGDKKYGKILELFAGEGNCTKIYEKYGHVHAIEKNRQKWEILRQNAKETAHLLKDSFIAFHEFIGAKWLFDIIDIDAYGFPNRFFPDIFLLIEDGFLFVTMPKPYVNILNGITQTHLISYYGEHNPSKETIVERIALWGLCHWRQVELIDSIDCKSVWRFCFSVKKVKATEYTGVKNR